MRTYFTYIVYFFIYGFFGWICESIYCSIGGKKIINRGFLNGPICPIYGFGALFVILMLRRYSENSYLLFFCAVIVTSILEYIASLILESMFQAKWWDYSHKFCNLNGRICLKNSMLFGILGVVLTKIIHPYIKHIVSFISTKAIFYITIILIIWLITEIVTTVNSLNKLGKKLEGIDEVKCELEKINVKVEVFDSEELKSIISQLKHGDNNIKIKLDEINKKIYNIKSKNKIQKRLFTAFPNMKHNKHHEQLQHLKEIFKEKSK